MAPRRPIDPLGAPAFQGEHNRSVFTELGLTGEDIDRHVASGALLSRIPANGTTKS